MEFRLPSSLSTAVARDLPLNVGASVSDFVAALQRMKAQRSTSRASAQAPALRKSTGRGDGGHFEASIPNLQSGFGYMAWQG